jgi:alpha-mannosidase
LENDILKVVFDEKGNVVSIFDKRTNQESMAKASRVAIIDENEHDTWSHGKNYFNKEIGVFECEQVEKLESNVVKETVKVCSSYGKSELTQYYTLHAGEDFVRVKVKLNWNEKHKMLKFVFPVKANKPTSLYEIPFGALERPCNGEEEPALTWAMVGDADNGLAVLNDSKYSYSANGNELALTGIRSPIYCDHGLKRSTESNYTDQGICEFSYALMPATTQDVARITKRALQLNTPLTAIMENHHNGCLPISYQGIAISQENIVLSAFKKAEDGEGYVLRAYECAGKAVSCEIDCKTLGVYTVDFTPYEAKTLRIQNGKIKEVLFTEYDLSES